VALTQWKKTI